MPSVFRSGNHPNHFPLNQGVCIIARELSISEQAHIRTVITAGHHPDVIDEYLESLNFSKEEIVELYHSMHWRRTHLLVCYRMKRNVRFVGLIVIALSVTMIVMGLSVQMISMIPIGTLAYGIAIMLTGNLTVFKWLPSLRPQTKRTRLTNRRSRMRQHGHISKEE